MNDARIAFTGSAVRWTAPERTVLERCLMDRTSSAITPSMLGPTTLDNGPRGRYRPQYDQTIAARGIASLDPHGGYRLALPWGTIGS